MILHTFLTDEVKQCGRWSYRVSKIVDRPDLIGALGLPDGSYLVHPDYEQDFINKLISFEKYAQSRKLK